ncbi:hypothetical protein EYF80_009929 [Liparis tanakae]|uniref:Uncharacterized protein n=1 Tax=Liparis tanakae TaxID=230148 RepID=A0A4Z2IRM0_9TELE|nr:hypothetical protein EYF80_009929 [Liparis tanakae]
MRPWRPSRHRLRLSSFCRSSQSIEEVKGQGHLVIELLGALSSRPPVDQVFVDMEVATKAATNI